MSYIFSCENDWTVSEDGTKVLCGDTVIAEVYGTDAECYPEETRTANARLMAGAQQMYRDLSYICFLCGAYREISMSLEELGDRMKHNSVYYREFLRSLRGTLVDKRYEECFGCKTDEELRDLREVMFHEFRMAVLAHKENTLELSKAIRDFDRDLVCPYCGSHDVELHQDIGYWICCNDCSVTTPQIKDLKKVVSTWDSIVQMYAEHPELKKSPEANNG